MSWEVYTPSPWPVNERKAVLWVTKIFIDELSFNEKSSELSSDNKEVSSDKEAALLGPLQPSQKKTESLSIDNVSLLIANDFMDVILFDEESSDVSSDNAAAILQS